MYGTVPVYGGSVEIEYQRGIGCSSEIGQTRRESASCILGPMPVAVTPLDRRLPRLDVRERFETSILAPAALVMEVAGSFDMHSLLLVRAIFTQETRVVATDEQARAKFLRC